MPIWRVVSLTDSGLVFYERRKKMGEEKKERFSSGRIVAAEVLQNMQNMQNRWKRGQHTRNFSLSL